jgi:hypothetical protein
LVIVKKRQKTIKSDQNGRASRTDSSKSAQKRRAQFNIFAPEPLWRYQEGRSAPKKARQNAIFTVDKNVSHRKCARLTAKTGTGNGQRATGNEQWLAAHLACPEQGRSGGRVLAARVACPVLDWLGP